MELLRFSLIGGLSAAVYAVLMLYGVEILDAPIGGAAAAATIPAIIINYAGHYYWTYRTDRPHRSSASRYLIAYGILFGVNSVGMAALPALLHLHYGIVQILVLIGIACLSYFSQKLWVFRRAQ